MVEDSPVDVDSVRVGSSVDVVEASVAPDVSCRRNN